MLRQVGAPLDPLTIEALEGNCRDEEMRWVGGLSGSSGAGRLAAPAWPRLPKRTRSSPAAALQQPCSPAPRLPTWLQAGPALTSTSTSPPPLTEQRLLGLAAAHGHLHRAQAPRRLLCAIRHGARLAGVQGGGGWVEACVGESAWGRCEAGHRRAGWAGPGPAHAHASLPPAFTPTPNPPSLSPNHHLPPPLPPQGVSDLDVPTFCSRFVDPMGEESDHVQLVALTDALQVRTGGRGWPGSWAGERPGGRGPTPPLHPQPPHLCAPPSHPGRPPPAHARRCPSEWSTSTAAWPPAAAATWTPRPQPCATTLCQRGARRLRSHACTCSTAPATMCVRHATPTAAGWEGLCS